MEMKQKSEIKVKELSMTKDRPASSSGYLENPCYEKAIITFDKIQT